MNKNFFLPLVFRLVLKMRLKGDGSMKKGRRSKHSVFLLLDIQEDVVLVIEGGVDLGERFVAREGRVR